MFNAPDHSLTQITTPAKIATGKKVTQTAEELDFAVSDCAESIYAHVPFCFHKCHYCDFYSFVDSQDRRDPFVDRIIGEVQAAAAAGRLGQIRTIFVGGGTPTLLTPAQWERLLDAFRAVHGDRGDMEFTVEANPETVDRSLLRALVAGGVNRLSIGAQSFDETLLRVLERHHDPANVARSISCARETGLNNINLDLIFAIPGQSMSQWKADLEAALMLEPEHLSCYSLMYEPNTALTEKLRQGRLKRVDESLEASMYEYAIDRLAAAGFEHYEVSAWAQPGRKCQHNLVYWTNGNWWPFGPSASGHVNGVRWRNIPRLSDYLASGQWPPIDQIERLDAAGRIGEELMLRLRLIEGIERATLNELLRTDPHEPARRAAINTHIETGHLAWADDHLQFTRSGLLVADDILSDLV